MTREDLYAALAQSPEALQSLFVGLSEAQRRQWAPLIVKLYRDWNKAPYHASVDGLGYSELANHLPCALLATATLSELKGVRLEFHRHQAITAILRDRRPAWLAEWAGHMLEKNPHSWKLIHGLCQEGLIETPQQEAYLMGMIVGSGRNSVIEFLDADASLLNHLPALFEVEGQGEFSLAAYDKYVSPERSWSHALIQLSQRGTISRQQLLLDSLKALQRDFETFRAGWFSRFHELLQPTLSERAGFAAHYLALLSSRVRPSVSFALRALHLLAKAGQLSYAELYAEVSPALASPDKGTALSALKLVLQGPRGSQQLDLLELALQHSHADVQAAALQALQKREPNPDPARWMPWAEGLAASLHKSWEKWLGQRPALPAVPPQILLVQPESAVLPCASLEELVQLTASLLEEPHSALEIERWLDGLVRFPGPHPARLTGPLLKRARQRIQAHERISRTDRPPLRVALARLVGAWLEPAGAAPVTPGGDFLQDRLNEVGRILAAGGCRGLLALPERPGGWISEPTLQTRRQAQPLWPLDEQAASWRLDGQSPSPAPAYRVETKVYETFTHRTLLVDWSGGRGPLLENPAEELDWLRWEASLWPAGREWWATRGLEAIANNLDWWEARWPDRAYLETLLLDQPLGPRATLLLAFALGCKQAEQVNLAIDVSLLALQRGHLQGPSLGLALAEATACQMIKPSRWLKSLGQLAQAWPIPVWEALQLLLGQAAPAFDAGPLLPLLCELRHQLDQPITDPAARLRLSQWTGGGKQARLARELAASR